MRRPSKCFISVPVFYVGDVWLAWCTEVQVEWTKRALGAIEEQR